MSPQLKSPNNFFINLLFWVAMVLIFIWFECCISGCNPVTKAVQRVLTNEPAFNKVGGEFVRLHPCVVDSLKVLVSDTVIKTDTAYKQLPGVGIVNENYLHDTVTRTITNTRFIHDSIKIVSVDKRAAQMALDSLQGTIIAFTNYRSNSTGEIALWKHRARQRLWILIALMAVSVIWFNRQKIFSLITGVPAVTKV